MRHFVHEIEVFVSKQEFVLPVLLVFEHYLLLDRVLALPDFRSCSLVARLHLLVLLWFGHFLLVAMVNFLLILPFVYDQVGVSPLLGLKSG